jgi:hypothetical protein
MSMDKTNRSFKGIWIPAKLWLEEDLSKQEVLFLSEIDSLDNDDGCYASNDYFAKFFRLSTARVKKIIQILVKKGYIERSFVYHGKTREIQKRVLRVIKTKMAVVSETIPCGIENKPVVVSETIPRGSENDPEVVSETSHIYQSNNNKDIISNQSYQISRESDVNDVIDKYNYYRDFIKENIEYDLITTESKMHKSNKDRIDEIVEIILDCICTDSKSVKIGKQNFPHEVVKSRFLKINSSHIDYIIDSLDKNTTRVTNIKEYLKTVIYNATLTIEGYYTAKVNHDLYGDTT